MGTPPIFLVGTQGERIDTCFCCCRCRCFLTPPSFNPLALWALPLYSLTETQGERIEKWSFFPILFLRPAMLRGTAEESLIPDFVAVTADVFLTPPSYGHLPYILLRKTQGRSVRCISFSLLLRFYIRHLVRLRGTAGEEVKISFR